MNNCLVSNKLVFAPGKILTSGMLCTLSSNIDDLYSALFSDYTDGIISGLDFYENGGKSFLSPGLFKWDGVVYRMAQPYCLEDLYSDKENMACIVFRFARKEIDGGNSGYSLELRLETRQKEYESDDFFLIGKVRAAEDGKFHIPDYSGRGIDEICEKLCNTRSELFLANNFSHAGRGHTTFHSWIFKWIKHVLLSNKSKNWWDYAILHDICCCGYVEYEVLEEYVKQHKKNFSDGYELCLKDLLEVCRMEKIKQEIKKETSEEPQKPTCYYR